MTLLWIALFTLVSEDLACIGAGLLVARGELEIVSAMAACAFGIFGGDLLLYGAGRAASTNGWVRSMLPSRITDDGLNRASVWIERRGPAVAILSRFTPGLRLPTYVAAGFLRVNLLAFSGWLAIAAALWTPLLVGAATVGGAFAERFSSGAGAVGLLVAAFLLTKLAVPKARGSKAARLIAGRFRRWTEWEFLPSVLTYLPLVPYLVWLMIRYRSMTIFTAANPGMLSGGFVGESKSKILESVGPAAARFVRLPGSMVLSQKIALAREFMSANRLVFPIVVKPDVGERGRGVVIARSERELCDAMTASTDDSILQEFIDGVEFGVSYCRFPSEPCGEIFSITEKRRPSVIGDGSRTLEELILADSRAQRIAGTYRERNRARWLNVIRAGESVEITSVGSHCRGAEFIDAREQLTDELAEAIDRICCRIRGFHIGRFDLKAPSIEALRKGEGLSVLELNGVTGEPIHIYDPRVSIIDKYRTLSRHWRMAFAIGRENSRRGVLVMPLAQLTRLIVASLHTRPSVPLIDSQTRNNAYCSGHSHSEAMNEL